MAEVGRPMGTVERASRGQAHSSLQFQDGNSY
jgi:hypothetical protein